MVSKRQKLNIFSSRGDELEVPPKTEKVFVLDNDECLGQFGLLSGLYSLFVTYVSIHTGIPLHLCLQVLKKYVITYYLANGGARPGTKDTLRLLQQYKDNKLIDKVVMFTSAKNTNNWVLFLKDCLESYAGVVGLYDLIVHRDILIPSPAPDGATFKDLELVRFRLDITSDSPLFMIDDKPHNILGEGTRIPVTPYRHVVQYQDLGNLIRDSLTELQTLFIPGPERYPPTNFICSLQTLIQSEVEKDIKYNTLLHKCPINQLNDTSLIQACYRIFIKEIQPPIPLTRTTSSHTPIKLSLSRTSSL